MAPIVTSIAGSLGVRAALVDGAWVPGDVEVRDGRIARVGCAPAGTGAVAVPGLLDVHLNGFAGVDFLTADATGHARAAAALAATGVTGHVPTFISSAPEAYAPALGAAAEAAEATAGSRVLGVHLEGPWLSPRWPGAHDPAHLRAPDEAAAIALCAAGPVVLVTLAPELPGALAVIAALRRRGVAVSLGHTDADAAAVRAALDAGAGSITHLHNAHRRWAARDPGPAGVALTDPRVRVMTIVDHVHLAPETSAAAWAAAGPRFVLVSDAMEAAGQGDGTYRLGDRVVTVAGMTAALEDGTLAGSVLTMDAAVRNLVGLGAPLAAAVHAATAAPAALLGRPDLGVLRPRARADVAVLDDRLEVVRTLVGGAEAYAR